MVLKKMEVSTPKPLILHTLLIAAQDSVGGNAGISPGLLFHWKGCMENRVGWSS
jgi:hypothetical protein